MKISFRKIWKTTCNIFDAILTGKLLMRLRATRCFPLILYAFVLLWLTILQRIGVDSTMIKVENNKDVIEELKIQHADMTLELASFNRISKIEQLLEQKSSTVRMPAKPADIIEK